MVTQPCHPEVASLNRSAGVKESMVATKTTVHDVIDELRAAPSTSQQGTKFEQLMVEYFHTDPTLQVTYDEVQGWSSWPHHQNSHDTGIDLVARNRDTGEWTAIQCKFYDPKHYLQKSDIDSFFTASGKSWDGVSFSNRIIISTTDKWSKHAEDALTDQLIPVQRIGLAEIAEAPIDWMRESQLEYRLRKAVRYGLRPHQKAAIAAIQEGFETCDRGKWISACGTGKTFTSLRLAEQRCKDNAGHLRVLFLAPSISLVSQTLREWMAQTQTDIRPFVVCSDTKASRQAEDISVHDIPLPTTDASKLVAALAAAPRRARGMQVVFSTYQSIDVVATAAKAAGVEFDLVLCDEAHRTTGVTLSGDSSESAFVKVHDNTYLPAAKRLYMTATPRIYGEDVKQKADDASAVLASMDDEALFGPEFHRLGFGEAVEQGLLADYKVMILVVDNQAIAENVQASLADDSMELSLDDAAKIVGCWNGLAKRTRDGDFGKDTTPMKRAVAFARNIKASTAFAEAFPQVVDALADDTSSPVDRELSCAVHHVDGTMNALIRAEQLSWLKAPIPDGECRILSNARCLSEGVDVPALDAVLFLSPRNSLVDVVQSVGRVMRKAPGKKYGYVILPVATPAGVAPEEALKDNKRYKVVWDVLNALRSHDDRFNAMINSINLDHDTKGKIDIEIIGQGPATDSDHDSGADPSTKPTAAQLPLFPYTQWRDSILARIVKKVGDREYWDAWADDVVDINTNQITRINTILAAGDPQVTDQFDQFLTGLRANLNDSIGPDDAVSMLSQHLITRPVFEALFEHASFAAQNPVSITMQRMVDALAGHGLEAETAKLGKFYDSVRRRAEGVTTAGGRQTVIHELYEQFFTKAFPKQASSFGVVYTPVEIVDFILRAADDVCRHEFGYGLTGEGVHVLDPFTGTGTFIVRLLESGIIRPDDLARKYAAELWANEIMLLAYYIACVNIETTYQALTHAHNPDADAEYLPFPGATLTDTFQISEAGDRADTSLIPVNSERIENQLATPIRVIIGNPPYSTGQESANDDNQNAKYPTLDARIAETYAALSTATNKNSLYDSYIRAFRWATDRIGDHGVIAFVSNNGWIDGNTADGIRKTMTDEYSHIWIYNLRGNARTAGITRQKEGGGVFDVGARTGVAVLIAAKNPNASGPFQISYHGVPDYQTRDDKLADIHDASIDAVAWQTITPNQAGDWLNQRNDTFTEYPAIGNTAKPTGETTYFTSQSAGVQTNRDAWCYNYSATKVEHNMARMINFYNQQATAQPADKSDLDMDPTQISWSSSLIPRALRGEPHEFDPNSMRTAVYRPYSKQALYFDPIFNHRPGKNASYFPTPHHENVGCVLIAPRPGVDFAAVMVDALPDLSFYTYTAQFFPRWTFEKPASDGALFASAAGEVDEYGYRRVDNITDEILTLYRSEFGDQLTKDDIFYYVYAVLHSEQYRETFAADLKRMLPRIPLAASTTDFEAFTDAGRKLADLHIGYESIEPYPLPEPTVAGLDEWELYRVQKMRWADKTSKKAIIYNSHITLSDVPAEAHRYMLGSRSALEWLIDRYRVKTDPAPGIVNDPNNWCREHDDPRYIVDLVKRVTRVSVDTMKIVDALPQLPIGD